MADDVRRYERIDIQLPCRLYIPGEGGALRFEAFTITHNLGLGGIFVTSTFLLRPGVELFAELKLPGKPLTVRARVSHALPLDRTLPSGMGLEFLGVDARGRETLLRFFTPVRYRQFHAAMVSELPHLDKELPLGDVSLVLNLWEEWKLAGGGGAPAPEPRRTAKRR